MDEVHLKGKIGGSLLNVEMDDNIHFLDCSED